MTLIKNKKELDKWKEDNIFSGDILKEPEIYPIFIYKKIISWGNQIIEAICLTESDLKEMISQLKK